MLRKSIPVWLLLTITYTSPLLADAPIDACRVRNETREKHAQLVNNAGCVVSRGAGTEIQFLLVYVDKGEQDRGWGFPGGKPATRENDLKDPKMKQVATQAPFAYSEPAYCTASREMREETGLEVLVGDLLDSSKFFAAFQCHLMALPPKELQTADPKEVLKIAWIPLTELEKSPECLRFPDNLKIMRALSEPASK